MKFNPTIGKIYDTIFFLTEYFNDHHIAYSCTPYHDIGDMLACHDCIKNSMEDIPAILKPFFFATPNKISVVTNLFFQNLHIDFHTYQDFSALIQDKSETLRDDLLSVMDDQAANNPNFELMGNNQIAHFFGRYEHSIEVLCKCLEAVYIEVDKLHNQKAFEIAELLEKSNSDGNKELYANAFKVSEEYLEEATFTFSLLNQYIVVSSPLLILGCNSEIVIVSDCDNKYTTVDNFIISFSGDTRVKVLNALVEHGELTASQIAKYIDCPPTTLIRPVSILLSNKMIYVSRRSGLNIYYRLNSALLKKTQENFNKLFRNIFEKEVYREKV